MSGVRSCRKWTEVDGLRLVCLHPQDHPPGECEWVPAVAEAVAAVQEAQRVQMLARLLEDHGDAECPECARYLAAVEVLHQAGLHMRCEWAAGLQEAVDRWRGVLS